ncbi:MAG: polysaccharide biosynthesis protein [Clostridia bacterium]|nr:polysaccharide biosynthesis protein [Clostridia bacterium]MDD4048309.1 polysaccharide biosynthesis protein [Clostridia bacterium]
MSKQSFLKGAFILVTANVLVKTLGFIYQILVIRTITTEGIGIYNMIFPLYITALVITTAGIPLAVSKFVAEETAKGNHYDAEQILKTAISILLFLSIIVSTFFILIAPYLITSFYPDQRVLPAFMFLLPALLLVGISSAIKGFFQGLQDMKPTAYAQLIEQCIRVFCGLILVYFLSPYGLIWSAVGLSIAVLTSELGGMIYLVHHYKKFFSLKPFTLPSFKIAKRLFSFGIPITITRLIFTTVAAIESCLIPQQLIASGHSLSMAASFYGELTGIALTLLTIPSTLTFSLATTLVPAISEAQGKNQKKLLCHRTSEAIGITLIVGIPCALILYFWGPIITKALFNSSQAGSLLRTLSLGSVFLYLLQTTSGILQGLGCVKIIFLTTLTGNIIKLSGIYFLGSHPLFGSTFIALSYVANYSIIAVLNLIIIKFKTAMFFEKGFFIRIIATSIFFIYVLTRLEYFVSQSIILLILFCFFSISIFFLTLYITGDKYIRLITKRLFNKVNAHL